MMQIGKFYGIGVGPGDPELLTLKALKALKKVDYIFQAAGAKEANSIAGNIISGFKNEIKAEIITLTSPMKTNLVYRKNAWEQNAKIILEKLTLGFNCAFITLGDPLIYSTCGYLISELARFLNLSNIEIISGITSFQAAAAKTKTVLVDDEEKLLIVPAYKNGILKDKAIQNAETVVLLKAYRTKNDIIDNLILNQNVDESIYVSRQGLDGEVIERDIEKIKSLPSEYLSLFILKKKNGNKK